MKPTLAARFALLRRQLKWFEREFRCSWKMLRPAPVTPYGFRLYGSRAMCDGTFEEVETRMLLRLLPHCDAFVNVGANVGYYCCHAIQAGVPTFAFEPLALNVRRLLANIRANGWSDRIEIYPVALGAGSGILDLFGTGTGASLIKDWGDVPPFDSTLVPLVSLDQILGARLPGRRCLVLVDIEGSEVFMLEGASHLLAAEPKPVWMVEVCVNQHQPSGTAVNPHLSRTFRYFLDHGYEAWTCTERPRRVGVEEIDTIARTGENTLETHNFVFADPGCPAFRAVTEAVPSVPPAPAATDSFRLRQSRLHPDSGQLAVGNSMV